MAGQPGIRDRVNRIAGEALRPVTTKVWMARGANRGWIRLTAIRAKDAKADR
jgi:hypothetical protein